MTRPVERTARRRARSAGGQASVELLGLLPLTAALTAGLVQALLAGYAGRLADHAALSAAIAVQRERDPVAAARAALPAWSEDGVRVTRSGRRVTVHLRPPAVLPGLGAALEARRSADAGPPAGSS